MAQMKEKAQTWHLKGALGLGVVFVAGLFVSGAFGGVSPLGLTSSGSTDTNSSSTASTSRHDLLRLLGDEYRQRDAERRDRHRSADGHELLDRHAEAGHDRRNLQRDLHAAAG